MSPNSDSHNHSDSHSHNHSHSNEHGGDSYERRHNFDHHYHHRRFRFDDPYFFGPDDNNPITHASLKEMMDSNLQEKERNACSMVLIDVKKCLQINETQEKKCSHLVHFLHSCFKENYKRGFRVKVRKELGDEFANAYFAKKEEMYQHQKLMREVADLIDRKAKLDKSSGGTPKSSSAKLDKSH